MTQAGNLCPKCGGSVFPACELDRDEVRCVNCGYRGETKPAPPKLYRYEGGHPLRPRGKE
jgi:ribosomal protein S27AE